MSAEYGILDISFFPFTFRMPDLKDILQRVRAKKQEKKKLSEVFRDALDQSTPYQKVMEQMKDLKAKKLQLESEIYRDFVREREKLDQMKDDIKTDQQLMSDMALSKLMKGENIEIVDENDTKYQPQFKVSFKKSQEQ